MRNLPVSEIYPIAAVVLLAVIVLVNQPILTIVASAIGLVVGLLVLRRGNTPRVVFVALAGFAAAIVIAVIGIRR